MKRFECRGVLFDLDGVLVDSTAFIEDQWRRWALAKGLEAEPFLRICHGRRALETIRLAAPHLDAEAEIAAFVPDNMSNEALIRPMEGAARLIQTLPSGSWAVATSGTRAAATERLTSAGLPVPAVMICAEDVVHGKPRPDVYLLAAAGLGLSPSDCTVIEDSPAGIEAARAAGMAVIALAAHPSEALAADACASSLASIHLGRIEPSARGSPLLELLVLDHGEARPQMRSGRP